MPPIPLLLRCPINAAISLLPPSFPITLPLLLLPPHNIQLPLKGLSQPFQDPLSLLLIPHQRTPIIDPTPLNLLFCPSISDRSTQCIPIAQTIPILLRFPRRLPVRFRTTLILSNKFQKPCPLIKGIFLRRGRI